MNPRKPTQKKPEILGKIKLGDPKLEDPYCYYEDTWICTCGNIPEDSGFATCNEKGEAVEPTAEEWTTNCYVCRDCGNIIDQDTLEIVSKASKNTVKKNLE